MKIKITYILLLLVSFATVACNKSDVRTGEPVSMRFDAATESEALDSFVENDQISLFIIDKDKEPSFTDFKYDNSLYQLAANNWLPVDIANPIEWNVSDKPIYVYSYSPVAQPNSPIMAQVGSKTMFNVDIPLDQTSVNLKSLDLLYSYNKGVNDEGLIASGASATTVPLSFKHKLCKVQIHVFVKPTTIAQGNITLKAVKLSGQQIGNKATFGLHDGVVNMQMPGSDINIVNTNTIEIIPSEEFDETKVTPAKFIIIPFTPKENQNKLTFEVEYINDEGLTESKSLIFNIPQYDAAANANGINFKENMLTRMYALLSLVNDEVKISSQINDWDEVEGPGEIVPH